MTFKGNLSYSPALDLPTFLSTLTDDSDILSFLSQLQTDGQTIVIDLHFLAPASFWYKYLPILEFLAQRAEVGQVRATLHGEIDEIEVYAAGGVKGAGEDAKQTAATLPEPEPYGFHPRFRLCFDPAKHSATVIYDLLVAEFQRSSFSTQVNDQKGYCWIYSDFRSGYPDLSFSISDEASILHEFFLPLSAGGKKVERRLKFNIRALKKQGVDVDLRDV